MLISQNAKGYMEKERLEPLLYTLVRRIEICNEYQYVAHKMHFLSQAFPTEKSQNLFVFLI